MKSISLQYQELKEGKMDKYQFLRNARMMFPNHVTNHNSFEDSVKILKNKGLLNEGDAVKGTPDKEPSYESPTPNADVKYKKVEQSPEVDKQDGIYPATTVTDIPKLKLSKKVKDKSDGLEPIKPHDTKNEMKKVKVAKATDQMLKEIYDEFDMEDELDYNNISDLEDELRRLIRWSNQYGSKGADTQIDQLKKRIEYLKSNPSDIKEAQNFQYIISNKPVDIGTVEFDGVDTSDYPDFSDAYVSYAEFIDGTPLTDNELDELYDEHWDSLYDKLLDSLQEIKKPSTKDALRESIKKIVREFLDKKKTLN
jgi:hypothetical protein